MALATNKQKAFLLVLMPDIKEGLLRKLTVEAASALIDKRKGRKPVTRRSKKQRSDPEATSIQVQACKKHGVSAEVRVTLLRDRPTPGVRTRSGSVAAGESLPAE